MAWTQLPAEQSCPCNSEMLRFFRERQGCSQAELADVAGCSETRIGTAEAGQPIPNSVIDDLAAALSTDEQPIYPEDLISDPLALAKEFKVAAFVHQKQMFGAIRHFLDEQVVFKFAGDPKVIPFAGRHQGLSEVESAMDTFFSVLEAPEGNLSQEPEPSFVQQGNIVIILGETWIHPVGAPMDEPFRVTERLTFRKGKLLLFESAFDTENGAKLLQSRPSLES